MMNVFLSIGSNLGDRRRNLSKAVAAIEKEFGYFELSHVVESEPWGYDSPNSYLNIGMMILTELPPSEVLHRLQDIERKLNPEPHRNADGTYSDRYIDIDIIAIDSMIIDTPELKVPHPRMAERRFVLEPLAEIAPFWQHPVLGKTALQLHLQLQNKK